MGINSKAIERIDKQIRMLKEDYTFNSIDDSYDYEIDDDFDEETEYDTEYTTEDTMKLNHIDEIGNDTKEQEEYDSEDTTKENIVTNITEENVPIKEEDITQKISNNSNESEEGINVFLIY